MYNDRFIVGSGAVSGAATMSIALLLISNDNTVKVAFHGQVLAFSHVLVLIKQTVYAGVCLSLWFRCWLGHRSGLNLDSLCRNHLFGTDLTKCDCLAGIELAELLRIIVRSSVSMMWFLILGWLKVGIIQIHICFLLSFISLFESAFAFVTF